jgi:hypothetical protein
LVFVNPLRQEGYSFFIMLALAGFIGVMLRNNLRLISDPTAIFSWQELFIEIGAGLLLAFALGLFYLLGALTVTGKTQILIPSSTAADFQRVAVVMTLLGVGGGLMIEKASERVRGLFLNTLDPGP